METHFSRLLLVVAAALPLGACFLTAEQIATNDDAACRSAGLKPGTPAYVKCREDRSRLRAAQNIEAQAMQRQMWSMRCTDWQRHDTPRCSVARRRVAEMVTGTAEG
jgi:hypothetical protein